MKVREGYYEMIGRLAEIYPDKAALSVTETAKVLGVDRRTILSMILKKTLSATDISAKGSKNKRYIVPVTAIARMLAG
jgi:excisionase family DNA binding protein